MLWHEMTSDERISALSERVHMSASEAARDLGAPSRNAVIGYRNRHRDAIGQPRVVVAKRQPPPPKAGIEPPPKPVFFLTRPAERKQDRPEAEQFQSPVVPVLPEGIVLIYAKSWQCKTPLWPTAGKVPAWTEQFVCGKPRQTRRNGTLSVFCRECRKTMTYHGSGASVPHPTPATVLLLEAAE